MRDDVFADELAAKAEYFVTRQHRLDRPRAAERGDHRPGNEAFVDHPAEHVLADRGIHVAGQRQHRDPVREVELADDLVVVAEGLLEVGRRIDHRLEAPVVDAARRLLLQALENEDDLRRRRQVELAVRRLQAAQEIEVVGDHDQRRGGLARADSPGKNRLDIVPGAERIDLLHDRRVDVVAHVEQPFRPDEGDRVDRQAQVFRRVPAQGLEVPERFFQVAQPEHRIDVALGVDRVGQLRRYLQHVLAGLAHAQQDHLAGMDRLGDGQARPGRGLRGRG